MSTQPFYYLGLEETVRELLTDPDLVAALGRSRTTDDCNTWWGNNDYRALDARLGGSLSQHAPPGSALPHHTLTMDMALDFGQMYDFKQEGVGILAVR